VFIGKYLDGELIKDESEETKEELYTKLFRALATYDRNALLISEDEQEMVRNNKLKMRLILTHLLQRTPLQKIVRRVANLMRYTTDNVDVDFQPLIRK